MFGSIPDYGPEAIKERREALDDLENEITSLAGHLNAIDYRFIKLLDVFDENNGWVGDGIRSFPHWLNWKCGISAVVGREKVRVARKLRELPQIDDAFRVGELSYSKVRAMTRVATPENENYLLELARQGTAAHIEHICRGFRTCVDEEARSSGLLSDAKDFKSLSIRSDGSGMMTVTARLPVDEAMILERAILKMRQEIRRDRTNNNDGSNHSHVECPDHERDARNASAEAFLSTPHVQDIAHDNASALALIAEHYLADVTAGKEAKALSAAERYQVVIHLNAHKQQCCTDEGNHYLSPEIARQVLCDTSTRVAIRGKAGDVLDIGRKSRVIPPRLAMAIRIRDDGCCRFPGCQQRRWTDHHHIIPWADGGRTAIDNLVTLCRFHHTRLHMGDYSLSKRNGSFVFRNKHGREITRTCESPSKGQDANDLAERIIQEHEQLGLQIHKDTTVPGWHGEPLILNNAIQALFDASG